MIKKTNSIILLIILALIIIFIVTYSMFNRNIENEKLSVMLSNDKLECDEFDYTYNQQSNFGNYDYKFTSFTGHISVWDILCSKDTEIFITRNGELLEGDIKLQLVSYDLSIIDEISNKAEIELNKGKYRLIMLGEVATGTIRIKIKANNSIILSPFFLPQYRKYKNK